MNLFGESTRTWDISVFDPKGNISVFDPKGNITWAINWTVNSIGTVNSIVNHSIINHIIV